MEQKGKINVQFKYLFETVNSNQPTDTVIDFDQITRELVYSEEKPFKTRNVHIGQRKLFLNELQFITDNVTDNGKTNLIIYAGAAPNNKHKLLSDIIPNSIFLLVDPNSFNICGEKPVYLSKTTILDKKEIVKKLNDMQKLYKENNILNKNFIINGYFNIPLAECLSEINDYNLYFISDIRTNSTDNLPDTLDILYNLAQQFNWLKILKPIKSMLKFRHPFYNDSDDFLKQTEIEPYKSEFSLAKDNGIDFISNFKLRKLTYFKGDIKIQPWAPQYSTETRLVTDCKNITDYDHYITYENKMFYYNCILRSLIMHKNENNNKKIGFDLCNDCSLENNIWTKFIKKYKPKNTDVLYYIEKLSKVIKRDLLLPPHGNFYAKLVIKK